MLAKVLYIRTHGTFITFSAKSELESKIKMLKAKLQNLQTLTFYRNKSQKWKINLCKRLIYMDLLLK